MISSLIHSSCQVISTCLAILMTFVRKISKICISLRNIESTIEKIFKIHLVSALLQSHMLNQQTDLLLNYTITDWSLFFKKGQIYRYEKMLLNLRSIFNLRGTFLSLITIFFWGIPMARPRVYIQLEKALFRGHPGASSCWRENITQGQKLKVEL